MTTKLDVTEVIAYKVFNEDWTCRGFQFEMGKSYHQTGKIVPCGNGFHACENLGNCFNYYTFDPKNKVAKVRLHGEIHQEGDKLCASDIDLLEELTWERVLVLANSGNRNSGHQNSGNRNSGHQNAGDQNSGNWNSGDQNSGHQNSGHQNSGHQNSGHQNSGHQNSGDQNSGNWNSGNRNSGHQNSGHQNSGHQNSGHQNSGHQNSGHQNSGNWNSGDWNSGNWNSGDWNSGYFNTDTPKTVRVFGKEVSREIWDAAEKPNFLYFELCSWVYESDMTDQEKIDNPKFYTAGGYLKKIPYKQAFINSWEKADKEDKKLVLQLPGFDKEMFYEISGIDIDKYDLS